MRLVAGLSLWLAAVGAAAAHGIAEVTPATLWRAWNFDPLVMVPLVLAASLYTGGLRRLWLRAGRGRGVTAMQALAFALGMALLAVALVSPLDTLGETLLAAHMAQHGVLVAFAPPLLLYGKPGVVFAWALRADVRKALLGGATWRSMASAGEALSRPLPAAALHGTMLWFWHAPAVFEAAVASYTLHAVEHLAFFATAILFWRAIVAARSPRRAAAALGAGFATLMHGGLLGALITLAPRPLYIWYGGRAERWGWSTLEDQQLAGLLMWVPLGVIYLGACLVLAGRLVQSETTTHSAIQPPSPGTDEAF